MTLAELVVSSRSNLIKTTSMPCKTLPCALPVFLGVGYDRRVGPHIDLTDERMSGKVSFRMVLDLRREPIAAVKSNCAGAPRVATARPGRTRTPMQLIRS